MTAPMQVPAATTSPLAPPGSEEGTADPPQAERLVHLASGAELFHTPNGEPHATIRVGSHHETHPIRSRGFRLWLVHRFYEAVGKPPGAQPLTNALAVLEAEARYDGSARPVFTRLADTGGRYYLDLANDAWTAIEVATAGWRLTNHPPVRFRRARGMLALPLPARGGSLEELRPFVNVASDDDWVLLVAWLVAALRPTGPYPVLVLQGEQGAAKSTTARVLRALVDPSSAVLRTAPRDERDLMIAASNAWVLAFDNLSAPQPWLSDALCRLATGGGLSTRELYTDAEEVIFDAQRPVILNGIDDLAGRDDLRDRAIILCLPQIPDDRRRDERAFWHELEAAQPRILGALLDVVSAALGCLPQVRLPKVPRMADFALWASAAEPAIGWSTGTFLRAYSGNRAEAVELAVEQNALAQAICRLAETGKWQGAATDLLHALTPFEPETARRTRDWPQNSRALGIHLRRLVTALRAVGVDVVFHRGTDPQRRRLIIVRKAAETLVRNVQNVQNVPTAHPRLDMSDVADGAGEPVSRTVPADALREPCPHGHPDGARWVRADGAAMCGICHPNPAA